MRGHHSRRFLWTTCMIACMGGLLFGYDWVVIGGAKPFFIRYFSLENSPDLIGWGMSSALVGCMIGAILSGLLSDKFGRKRLLILAAFLFFSSSIGTGLAMHFSFFVFCRVAGGVGIGLASNLSPMYIGEVAPAELRGSLVALNQFMIDVGLVAAQLVNWLLVRGMPAQFADDQILHSWYGQVGWRWMFIATAIPALFFFLLMFLVPESPRWLVKAGCDREALDALTKLGGEAYAQFEVEDIRKTLSGEEISHVRFSDLLNPKLLFVILIGMGLATLQQWSGLNAIFYYAEDIFRAAGYSVNGTMLNIVYTGLVTLFFTVGAILTVDRWGRRPLMLLGTAGIALLLGLLGAGFYFGYKGLPMLIIVLLTMAVYAFTLAPIMWVLLSELFPNRIRGAALSISVLTLWVTCWALAQFFPRISLAIGNAGSFWMFSAICLGGFIFVWKFVPETKGKSLEAIERQLLGAKSGSGETRAQAAIPQ